MLVMTFLPFSVEKKNDFGNIMRHNLKRGETDLMIKPTLTALCLLASCGTMLHAEGEVVDSTVETKVYYLWKQDNSSTVKSWSTPANWVENCEKSGNVLTFSGSAPADITSNDEFVVPAHSSAWTLRTPNSGAQWNGKKLIVGRVYDKTHYRGRIRHSAKGEDVFVEYCNEGLFLEKFSRYEPVESGILNAKGIVTVTADENEYAAELFLKEKENSHLIFHGPFKGEKGVYAKIMSEKKGSRVTFKDASGYFGLMEVSCPTEEADMTVCLERDFSGTLVLNSNCALVPKAVIKIANLTLNDGAVIDLENSFEVTGSVVHSGKIRLIVHEFEGEDPAPRSADITIKMPSSDFTLDDFEIVTPEGKPCIGQTLLKNEDGTVKITVIKPGYVTLLSGDDGKYSGDYASSMTNAANWSDGRLPTNPLVDYFAAYNLRTADSSADWTNPTDDFVFEGRSLTIEGEKTRFLVCNRSFRCEDLIFCDGAQFYKRRYSGIKEDDYHNLTLSGTITVADGKSPFYVGYYEILTLGCSFKGAGTVCLTSLSGVSTEASRGKFAITGTSPEFMGSIVVTIPYNMPSDPNTKPNNITPRFDRNYTTLNLTDKGNLGGKLPAVNPKAFTIENMSQVKPAVGITSLTLDEPTRGIFIKWVGRLMANEGQTFTVKSPLAVHGTLWKEGGGTLGLVNPAPTFGENADSDTPDADATNRMFRVAAGDVKIASGDAVNGLDVVFTNSASRLVLDLDSEDETFRTYGLRNTKSSVPFMAEGELDKIPVVLYSANPPAIGSSCGLVTVASVNGNPGTLVSCLSFVKSPALNGIIVHREWVDNKDGTFTLKATFKDVGMRIVIR
jgi:hypothetical protein